MLLTSCVVSKNTNKNQPPFTLTHMVAKTQKHICTDTKISSAVTGNITQLASSVLLYTLKAATLQKKKKEMLVSLISRVI